MASTDREQHYTAHIEVNRVLHAVPANNSLSKGEKREIYQIADVVVRSKDLASLLSKLSKHVELIEED